MWQRFLIKGAEIFFKTFREAWKETATRKLNYYII